jgi:integrase/recombinase XerD
MTDYLQCLHHERGASKATVTCYGSYLFALLRWLEENGHPAPTLSDFNTPTLRRYLYYHSARGLMPKTLHGRFYPIKGLAKFLLQNGVLEADPTTGLTLPKPGNAERKPVTDSEVALLLDAAERLHNPRRVALCRAVLAVLCFAGLRRQECLDLRVDDVCLTEQSVTVLHGKGDKRRRVYLPDVAVAALSEWLALRPMDTCLDWLFLLDRSRRVGQDGLANLLEELKAVAGLRGLDHIKPHGLRHAYATRLLRNGADLRSIQSALGHADLRVTNVYLHADEERLRDVRHLAALQPQPETPKEADAGNIIRAPQRDRERRRLHRIAR